MRTAYLTEHITRMTLAEAIEKRMQYKYLIGTAYKEDEINDLVVIPAGSEPESELIFRAAQNLPYDDLIERHREFTIIALLNLDDFPFNSNLYWRYLDDILDEKP